MRGVGASVTISISQNTQMSTTFYKKVDNIVDEKWITTISSIFLFFHLIFWLFSSKFLLRYPTKSYCSCFHSLAYFILLGSRTSTNSSVISKLKGTDESPSSLNLFLPASLTDIQMYQSEVLKAYLILIAEMTEREMEDEER